MCTACNNIPNILYTYFPYLFKSMFCNIEILRNDEEEARKKKFTHTHTYSQKTHHTKLKTKIKIKNHRKTPFLSGVYVVFMFGALPLW